MRARTPLSQPFNDVADEERRIAFVSPALSQRNPARIGVAEPVVELGHGVLLSLDRRLSERAANGEKAPEILFRNSERVTKIIRYGIPATDDHLIVRHFTGLEAREELGRRGMVEGQGRGARVRRMVPGSVTGFGVEPKASNTMEVPN